MFEQKKSAMEKDRTEGKKESQKSKKEGEKEVITNLRKKTRKH